MIGNLPRTVTVLGLVQIVCVLAGFLGLGITLKVQGYPEFPPFVGEHWSGLAVGLRTYGLWLLVIPPLWAWYATAAVRLDRRGIFSETAALASGVAIVGIFLAAFLHAVIYPFGSLHSP